MGITGQISYLVKSFNMKPETFFDMKKTSKKGIIVLYMNKAEAKKRIEKLTKQIEDLRHRYHVLDDPEVTDDVYDSLTRELRSLEQQFPEFADVNSPLNRVAGKPLDKFVKVEHAAPMLSLNDVFSLEDLEIARLNLQSARPRVVKVVKSFAGGCSTTDK
jgi:DNA ligase (NAD+)